MTPSGSEAHEILSIRLHGGRRFLDVAGSAVAGVARGLGYTAPDVERVQTLVDSLCTDVAECHFDDPRDADFRLIVSEQRGGLRVRIEDEGLPYPIERLADDARNLLSRRVSRDDADALRFESRGLGGNAVELCIHRSPHHETHLAEQDDPGTAPLDADAPIEVRPLEPADTPGVARCVYRCYGYTYANDFVYYPDQLLSLIERDLLRSFVALNPEGEVVGHSGVLRDSPESRVAESGLAVVDPRYRHHHLLAAMKGGLLETASREFELLGTYADAVAVHLVTQRANAAIGARETGLLLAEIPGFTTFRGFANDPEQRGSVVVYYRPLREAPGRDVFVPPRFRGPLDRIYAGLGLERRLRDPGEPEAEGAGTLHVELKPRRGLARIEVVEAGAQLAERVAAELRELCRQRLDVIHLDLPLGSPAAMAAAGACAEQGFLFGAVIPELRDGDVLRLQYLNDVDLDPDAIVLYSDSAKRLLAEILAERA